MAENARGGATHATFVSNLKAASVPDRGAHDQGTLDYQAIFKQLDALGWKKPLGAEYRNSGPTAES